MNPKYSDNLLDEIFKVIDEKLDKIIEQTTKHNGRMSKAESWIASAQGFMSALTLFVVPTLMYLLYLRLGK